MTVSYSVGNLINSDTLSAVSSEDAKYKKEYMFNQRQSLPWRMTSKTSQYATFNLGSATQVTILGILNHNLTSGATITLKANTSDSWASPPYSQSITWHKLNIYYLLNQTYQWFRVEISDSGNSLYPEVGELILNTYVSLDRVHSWGYPERKFYIKTENVTRFGQRWRNKIAEKKSFSLNFEQVLDSKIIAEIEAMFDDFDGQYPFIFIPDNTANDCWYMEVLNDFEAQRLFKNNSNFALELEEQSRGITLL